MANSLPSHYANIGDLGEHLVAEWLQSTGWMILHRRFSCRCGEIDIIAQYQGESPGKLVNSRSILAFIEVKTRSAGNWDAGGRSAITLQKQAKICRTANMFLVQNPEKSQYPCRFDVAIVYYRRNSNHLQGVIADSTTLASFYTDVYQLELQEYIPAAFDYSSWVD